jgi:hypothetical protein
MPPMAVLRDKPGRYTPAFEVDLVNIRAVVVLCMTSERFQLPHGDVNFHQQQEPAMEPTFPRRPQPFKTQHKK